MEAIRTLQTLENENRNATPEEQEILFQYVGWVGLADAFDLDKDSWAKPRAASPSTTELTAQKIPAMILPHSFIKQLDKRYGKLSDLVRGLYENYVTGILPERQYQQRMKQYDEEQAAIEVKISKWGSTFLKSPWNFITGEQNRKRFQYEARTENPWNSTLYQGRFQCKQEGERD